MKVPDSGLLSFFFLLLVVCTFFISFLFLAGKRHNIFIIKMPVFVILLNYCLLLSTCISSLVLCIISLTALTRPNAKKYLINSQLLSFKHVNHVVAMSRSSAYCSITCLFCNRCSNTKS